MEAGRIFVGTSGWHYGYWIGPFYPEGTPDAEMLSRYAARFGTVEINNSFYRLPSRDTFAAWKRGTPPGFLFAVKGSRYITHMKKLKDAEGALREFFSAAEGLGRKLGPVLFQLPPGWKADPERLGRFLDALPAGRRCAFEFRDPAWHVPEVYDLLRRRNAAFCAYELAGFRSPLEVTADFAYVRLHGPGRAAYQGRYGPRALDAWAGRLREWSRSLKAVYLYFDNDAKAHAAENAAGLRVRLGRTSFAGRRS